MLTCTNYYLSPLFFFFPPLFLLFFYFICFITLKKFLLNLCKVQKLILQIVIGLYEKKMSYILRGKVHNLLILCVTSAELV